MKNICFASYYFKPTKVENDYQPDCPISAKRTVDSLGLALPKLRLTSSL